MIATMITKAIMYTSTGLLPKWEFSLEFLFISSKAEI